MTSLLIRARQAAWWLLYHGHLLLLLVLAAIRYLAVGVALAAHRAHTAVARNGVVVADTLGSHTYTDDIRPRPERYARMAHFLLNPKDDR